VTQDAGGPLPGQSNEIYGKQVNLDLLDFISPVTGVVLDIGCGIGEWGNELRLRGAKTLVGVEPDPHAAAVVRGRYDDVWEGTVEDCPLERWRMCDLIICADVLEHLHDPWTALRRLRDISSSETRLVVSIPNLRYLRTILRLGFRGDFEYSPEGGYFDVGHLRWFTRKSLNRALDRSGWRVISSGGRSGTRLRRISQSRIGGKLWPDLLRHQIFAIAIPAADRVTHGAP